MGDIIDIAAKAKSFTATLDTKIKSLATNFKLDSTHVETAVEALVKEVADAGHKVATTIDRIGEFFHINLSYVIDDVAVSDTIVTDGTSSTSPTTAPINSLTGAGDDPSPEAASSTIMTAGDGSTIVSVAKDSVAITNAGDNTLEVSGVENEASKPAGITSEAAIEYPQAGVNGEVGIAASDPKTDEPDPEQKSLPNETEKALAANLLPNLALSSFWELFTTQDDDATKDIVWGSRVEFSQLKIEDTSITVTFFLTEAAYDWASVKAIRTFFYSRTGQILFGVEHGVKLNPDAIIQHSDLDNSNPGKPIEITFGWTSIYSKVLAFSEFPKQ